MTCETAKLPGGVAIVCSSRRNQRCKCGNKATLLCDWKLPTKRLSGTCDKPLCTRCTFSPAPDKDLCPDHSREWEARRAARA